MIVHKCTLSLALLAFRFSEFNVVLLKIIQFRNENKKEKKQFQPMLVGNSPAAMLHVTMNLIKARTVTVLYSSHSRLV